MKKEIYFSQSDEQLFDKIMELNPEFNFSKWVRLKLNDEIDKLQPRKDDSPAVILSQCLYPKFKGKYVKCKWQNCPVIDPTDYPKAKQNLFSQKVQCIFRGG